MRLQPPLSHPLPPPHQPPPNPPPHTMPPPPGPPHGVIGTPGHPGTVTDVGQGRRHKIVYRVATSSGTHGVPTAETLQEAIAAAQEYLREHAQNAQANPGQPPPSGTVTITATSTPPTGQ